MSSGLYLTVLCALIVPSHQQANSPPVFKNTPSDELVYRGIYESTPVAICDAENEDEKPNSVTFECVDLNSRGEEKSMSQTFVDLVITVLDNNDQKPEFADSVEGLTFSVMENDPVGTVLQSIITVIDKDRGINAKLSSFTIYCEPSDPEPCQKFNLNYTEVGEGDYRANIVLRETLDYERRVDYHTSTSIRAIDGPGLPTTEQLTASTGIQIVVGDSQDIDPLFKPESQLHS